MKNIILSTFLLTSMAHAQVKQIIAIPKNASAGDIKSIEYYNKMAKEHNAKWASHSEAKKACIEEVRQMEMEFEREMNRSNDRNLASRRNSGKNRQIKARAAFCRALK